MRNAVPALEEVKSYKTYANAFSALEKIVGDDEIRYVIVATKSGRFVPALVGAEYIEYIHAGVTVIG